MNNITFWPEILNAKDLSRIFRISLSHAYQLLNRADFPTLHMGGRKFVTRENLLRWMDENTQKVS